MGFYEINTIFALVIGALVSLSLSTFFRRGGPWAKRSRVAAMWKLQSNRLKRRMGIATRASQDEAGAQTSSINVLFWVLVVALVLTITITVLQVL